MPVTINPFLCVLLRALVLLLHTILLRVLSQGPVTHVAHGSGVESVAAWAWKSQLVNQNVSSVRWITVLWRK